MRNRRWWAMSVVTVVIAVACSSTPATPAPASHAPTSAAPGTAAAATATAAAATTAPSVAPAVPTVPSGYKELDTALTPGADGKLPYAGKAVDIQVQWTAGELA